MLILAAVATAAAAFVLLRPEPAPPERAVPRDTAGSQPTTTVPADGYDRPSEPPDRQRPDRQRPRPRVTRLDVRGGGQAGAAQRIRARRGDTVRLDVIADVADEVHVHGYDVTRRVAPGSPARLRFRARLEGVFEIELEQRGVQVAELEVRP